MTKQRHPGHWFPVQSVRLIALITMSITAGGTLEGQRVMGDRRISNKREGNMLSSCVKQAYMNALETTALTEKQQKVKVCEKRLTC